MDIRVARTRGALQDALLQLAREHPLDEITVADIAERAGVNRSSFYQHYTDKDTLLADALDAIAAPALDPPLPQLDRWPDHAPDILALFLTQIDQNPQVYRQALGPHGSAVVTARLRDRIESVAQNGLTPATETGFRGIPVEVISAGLVGAALGVVRAWLDQEPRPPVDVAVEWVWRILTGPSYPD